MGFSEQPHFCIDVLHRPTPFLRRLRQRQSFQGASFPEANSSNKESFVVHALKSPTNLSCHIYIRAESESYQSGSMLVRNLFLDLNWQCAGVWPHNEFLRFVASRFLFLLPASCIKICSNATVRVFFFC